MADDALLRKSFCEKSDEIQVLIARRRASWRLTSVMEYEDVSSIILAHVWKEWAKYDPERPLDKWINTIITNQIRNLLRNHLYKHSRPCCAANQYGAACSFNRGGDLCAWTKSGIQDESCHFYAHWLKRKQAKFAVATPLSMAAHENETHSKPDDHMDIEGAKKTIDDNIKRRLTKEEYRIYKYLYVEHLSIEETAKKMGYKKRGKEDMRAYMAVRNVSLHIKEVSKAILSENGIIR
jgi:RNA polymerase sigma factor (sigma-70 family)